MGGSSLTDQRCVPCEGDAQPMKPEEYTPHLQNVPGWNVQEEKKIEKGFKFKDFKEALSFVDKVGALAELEGHHPDVFLHGWNKVLITLSTHAIKGLSLNDFIMAAKINQLGAA